MSIKNISEHIFTPVEVKKSRTGLGLYSPEPLKKGQKIVEYFGEKISTDEANRRGGKYLFELNSHWTIDGKSRQNIARYVNHSCRPNCEVVERKGKLIVVAKRKIKAGEELYYDYGKEYFKDYIGKNCMCEKCQEKR